MSSRPRRTRDASRGLPLAQLLPPFSPTHPATRWLFGLARAGMLPGLDRIEQLLQRWGNPQRALTCLVVAGTNGKGSAAAYLEALARRPGIRTGLYTSPHLLHPGERVIVDGRPLDDAQLVELVQRCRADILATGATFFEAMTAMALRTFQEAGVSLAVLETGLGGRLDATNAVDARAVLLTSIGDDHHQVLGDSLPAIALEKLGLARAGRPFYLGQLPEGIDRLAHATLARVGAVAVDLAAVGSAVVAWDGREATVELRLPDARLQVQLPQRGAMQARMAALAAACYCDLARRNGWPLPDLARALRGVRVPCRYEAYGNEPELLLDGAHNAPALEQLLAQWSAERPYADRLLVFGVMRDKRLDAVLPQLTAVAPLIVVTAPQWERALPPAELAVQLRRAQTRSGAPAEVVVLPAVTSALEEVRRRARRLSGAGRRPSVLVTGSNFLVAEVLDRLGIDDLFAAPPSPLWDSSLPLRARPLREQEVASS